MEKLTIASFFWRDNADRCQDVYQYDNQDVVLLRNQFQRHLTRAHEFICVTNRPREIDPSIRTVPLDERLRVRGGRYFKLAVFAENAAEVFGERILTVDLDSVITGNIDHLVDRDEDLVLWRNPNWGLKRRAYYNTSLMLVRAGTRPEFYDRFDPKTSHDEAARATGWGGTDQRYISWIAGRKEAHWTAEDGVYGAGRLGDYCPGMATTVLPENACFVTFPGRRHPKMAKTQEKHTWIKKHRL